MDKCANSASLIRRTRGKEAAIPGTESGTAYTVFVMKELQAAANSAGESNRSAARSGKARTLPGGQRRRLCLAQTLVTSLQLLLLDESSVELDPTQREGYRRVRVFWTGGRVFGSRPGGGNRLLVSGIFA